jgi:hypothetical protein
LLRTHGKGPYRSWIDRLRKMQRLSRLRLEQWRQPLEDRYYDSPPLPSLLVAFKERDAIPLISSLRLSILQRYSFLEA